ncbi:MULTISPECIES: hypothetical protein [Halobacillus]|uniref:Uncharacterized protein n=1 Tax=Halobacillus halophilus (strain ATCC 35676 / DSM 2266 / JCM 20832 / KCTC 3685 / LMG 17431 / NBRC 102448 / NCIMB 2269) TaxID=866895 RepID=I0JL48_HALH3|nr:hypothetical protein [Halobacillus halophilus]ASF38990.1 hypothetical protein CEH05_07645 [Halobacillus halophilus]CCG44868.1 hypothetical protein HBHAL_2523 [Halobacillus halophilus DSM 2266]
MDKRSVVLPIGIIATIIILFIGITDYMDDGGSLLIKCLIAVVGIWIAVKNTFKRRGNKESD